VSLFLLNCLIINSVQYELTTFSIFAQNEIVYDRLYLILRQQLQLSPKLVLVKPTLLISTLCQERIVEDRIILSY
jgi:hypothetical protein